MRQLDEYPCRSSITTSSTRQQLAQSLDCEDCLALWIGGCQQMRRRGGRDGGGDHRSGRVRGRASAAQARSRALTALRIIISPTLLTGICFCVGCGVTMTLRTGKGGSYRYYTCSTKARQGETTCKGRTARWTSSTESLPTTSSIDSCNPGLSSKSCPQYSTVAKSARSAAQRISLN
jgi:hypothetical protein